MGQAFRRATGRLRSVDQSQPTKPRRPLGPTDEQKISRVSQHENLDHGNSFPPIQIKWKFEFCLSFFFPVFDG